MDQAEDVVSMKKEQVEVAAYVDSAIAKLDQKIKEATELMAEMVGEVVAPPPDADTEQSVN